jgi:hypothetical protein
MNIYKIASTKRLRFASIKGQLAVEDLFSLPLTSANGVSLDGIAKGINKFLKEAKEESFVDAPSKENTLLQVRLDIVKDIISDKIAERELAKNIAANKVKKQKLLAALARKEDEGIDSMSEADILKQLDDLA